LDQFIGTSKEINALYDAWWQNHINESGIGEDEKPAWLARRKPDRENTIGETLELLKQSGFKNAECIYAFMKFGVVLAMKE
jgi:tRNA (cmo5U34)-methyltransferase